MTHCKTTLLTSGNEILGSVNIIRQSNTLADGETIKEVDVEKGYKYLGILEADEFRHNTIKTDLIKEYFVRVRKIFKSKLNGNNSISAIKARTVSLLRYSAGIKEY